MADLNDLISAVDRVTEATKARQGDSGGRAPSYGIQGEGYRLQGEGYGLQSVASVASKIDAGFSKMLEMERQRDQRERQTHSQAGAAQRQAALNETLANRHFAAAERQKALDEKLYRASPEGQRAAYQSRIQETLRREQDARQFSRDLDAARGNYRVPGLGAAASGFASAGNVLHTGAGIGRIAGNSMLSGEQKAVGIAEQLPIVGQAISGSLKFAHALAGTYDQLAKVERSATLFNATLAEQSRRFEQIRSYQRQANQQGHLAAAFGSMIAPPVPVQGASYKEYLAYQEQRSLLAPRQRAEIARAEADAARKHALDTASGAADRLRGLQAQREFHREASSGYVRTARDISAMSPGQRAYALEQARQHSEKAKQMQGLIDQQIARTAETTVAAVERERAAREATLAIEKQQLAILEQREQRMAGQAGQFQSLNRGQQRAALRALERVNRAAPGQERLHDLQLIAGAGGGMFVQKRREQMAEANPLFQQFRKGIGEQADTFAGLREAIAEKNKAIFEEERAIRADMAKELQKIFADTAKAFGDQLKGVLDALKNDIERGFFAKAGMMFGGQ